MKTRPWIISICTAGLALAVAAPSALAADKTSERSGKVVAAENKAGQKANRIIGQDVRSMAGEELGRIHDLVIDSKDGRIVYALVSSGGFLGIGDTVRAVPFAALSRSTMEDDQVLILDLKGKDWKTAPAIRQDQVITLTGDQRGGEIFEFYQQDWPRGTAKKSGADGAQLARVSELDDVDVRHQGRTVGEIDDVIVNFEQKRAFAVLEPEDDVIGTDRELAISFSQLSRSMADERVFETSLTPEQLGKAAPMPANRDLRETDYPFVWGFGDQPGTTYATAAGGERRQATIDNVRAALRNEPEVRDALEEIELKSRGDKLVVTGRVRTQDAREEISDRISDLATGWNIDNRITVGTAAE